MSPKNCNQRNRTAIDREMFLRGDGMQLVAGDRHVRILLIMMQWRKRRRRRTTPLQWKAYFLLSLSRDMSRFVHGTQRHVVIKTLVACMLAGEHDNAFECIKSTGSCQTRDSWRSPFSLLFLNSQEKG